MRKIRIPAIYVRTLLALIVVGTVFASFMIYDYVQVMQQLANSRQLTMENHQLREKIQIFSNKIENLEKSLARIQIFAAKLRIITNQVGEDLDELKEKTDKKIPGIPMDDHSSTPGTTQLHNHSIDRQRRPQTSFSVAPYPLQLSFSPKKMRPAIGGPPLTTEEKENVPPPTSEEQEEKNMELPPTAPSFEKKKQDGDFRNSSSYFSRMMKKGDEISRNLALEAEFVRLEEKFQRLSQHASLTEQNVQGLISSTLSQKDYLEAMPTIKPANGWYSSGFGMRASPYTGLPTMHEGIDIAGQYGRKIIAPASGTIAFVGRKPGYGKLVTIDHGYGIKTQYAHLSKFYVKEGDRVKRGQRICAVGSSGRSTGPHLHYEVRVNDIPVNPYFYILED